MNIYQKWIVRTFSITILFFITILGFNYKVDTAGIFSTDSCLRAAAHAMANGKIVAGLGDEAFDGRLFQILFIKEIKKEVDIIALGSSRTKEVRQRYLSKENLNFYNHSVNDASMQDYIAILGAYKKIKKYLPKEIIIGIDPWAFNKNSGRNRWKSISEYYDYMQQEISSANIKTDKIVPFINNLKQLGNYEYTLTNIRYLYRRYKKQDNGYYIAKDITVDDYLREPDGSLHYPDSVKNLEESKLITKSKNYAAGNIYSLENYHELAYTKNFNALIQYLKKEDVKITLFLPPYNPIPYDILKTQKKYRINEIENYLRKYAYENNLNVIGSYNPHKLNLQMSDFFDGMHLKDENIEIIFKDYK